jgi:hypothetical protein
MSETMRVKPKLLQWGLKEVGIPKTWNICPGKPEVMTGASTKQRPWELQPARIQRWGCPRQLELTSWHNMPQLLDMELQVLMFALLGFGLA